MYTLHWSPETGSFAPHAALEEAGADYRLVEVDLHGGAHHSEEFLALNPRAQVPVLTLPDGTVMTESAAMMMHIADCHPEAGLLPPVGTVARARAYRWLMFGLVNLYETDCRIVDTHHYSARESDFEGIRAKAREDLGRSWDLIAAALGKGPYILGRDFCAVDLCLLMYGRWHPERSGLVARHPALGRLFDALRRRPAVDAIWERNFGSAQ